MAATIVNFLKPWTPRVAMVRWKRYNPYYLEPEPRREVKFVNMIMQDGNKVLAVNIMTQTLERIKRKQVEKYHKAPDDQKAEIECNPYAIFHQALENCKPVIGLTTIKKGGKNYQVPIAISDNRRRFLAMKWLITECRDNKHRRTHMYEKLSQELLEAFAQEGKVIKRKHDLHKMAEANRAFAHFRWT
ncbi:hypothetical protein JZ751_013290 [Albula glossodonta]|uniref:Small ribosomal subunit protein uS7m n=1 Tax=Albula glossodonta TaxID=121402 RepID=A0A8T2NSJ2_9TELE|nr:hypothetical protein JZ751_013290 [Albula glossodonta]